MSSHETTTASTSDDARTQQLVNDPYYERTRRDPIPADAGIRAVILTSSAQDLDSARIVAESLEALAKELGRSCETKIVAYEEIGLAEATRQGLENASQPLALITTASKPWTSEHLKPLLNAIDVCDHVFGGRRRTLIQRFKDWLGRAPWKILFAIPGIDVDTPCRLHRLEALQAIPLQSRSRFANVELLAKATYFTQVIGDARVPYLGSVRIPWSGRDASQVYWRPILKSIPSLQT